MRCWQVREYGEPRDVAGITEMREPDPAAGEIVVAPEAVGLSLADTIMCRGSYQDRPVLPYTPGFELAGTVTAVGEGVGLAVGARVVAVPDIPPGSRGGLAERVALPAANAIVLPDRMPAAQAAALPNNYVTAHLALHRRGRVEAGETVLVLGAAGGVGSAAIEVAVAAGATVIAAARGADRAELCRSLGAEHVVDTTQQDVVEAVIAITGGRGVDVVVDPVGGEAFERCRKVMAFEGRLLVIGFPAGIGTVKANHALLRGFSVVGVNRDMHRRVQPDVYRAAQDDVLRLWSAGALAPAVEEIGFEEVLDGWERLEQRAVLGKLVVRMGSARP